MCRKGHVFSSLQSNAESDFIGRLHEARDDGTEFMIVNFGGFTHTSVAIRDAIIASEIPFIEVHLSNLFSREEYRQFSFLAILLLAVSWAWAHKAMNLRWKQLSKGLNSSTKLHQYSRLKKQPFLTGPEQNYGHKKS